MSDLNRNKLDVDSPDFNFDSFFEGFTVDMRKCINLIKESEAKIKTVIFDSNTDKSGCRPVQGNSVARKEVTVSK